MSEHSMRGQGEGDDVGLVAAAARSLGTNREFELFRRAYRAWFGHDADEKALERVFVGFLYARRAPSWVRHYCQRLLANAPPPPPRPGLRPVAVMSALALIAGWFVALVSPGCAGGRGATLSAEIAHDAGLDPCPR